jgi:hypothetical protein
MIALMEEINLLFAPKFPACHQESPRHKEWIARVQQLESEGLETSDAQGISDMEIK